MMQELQYDGLQLNSMISKILMMQAQLCLHECIRTVFIGSYCFQVLQSDYIFSTRGNVELEMMYRYSVARCQFYSGV